MKKVALLSNVTINLLGDMMRKDAEVYIPEGFDVWQQEIYSSLSCLYQGSFDAIVIILYAQAYQNVWQNRDKGNRLLKEWLDSISTLLDRTANVPVYVSSLDIQEEKCCYGAEQRKSLFFEHHFRSGIEEMHATGKNVYVLPIKDLIEEYGRKSIYSPKMWYMGSMPYSLKGIQLIGEMVKQYLFAANGSGKKCLALDLDHTLWGGVIGEDGVEGICLSEQKEGARYKDAQRLLKKMRQQGVMLVVISKNNASDVEAVFEHPDMVLQHEDFVAEKINWKPKPENIKELSEILNIGLDAFVFLDDNPAEREMMRAQCPEVTVVEFPKDTALLPDVIDEIYKKYFFTLEIMEEDQNKTRMYQEEAKRKEAFQHTDSLEDYLKCLEMEIDIHLMKENEEKRVVQLLHKTNQFNLTTKRYSAEDVHAFRLSEDSDIITASMSDKYGQQGLISVIILKYENNCAFIDTFLMSCRVMGRNVEQAMLGCMKFFLQKRGLKYLKSLYIRTAKNQPVELLYENMGFQLLGSDLNKEDVAGIKEYQIDIDCLPELPACFANISMTEEVKG